MYGITSQLIDGIVLQTDVAEIARSINNVWILLASFLVFIMQPGFALLEAGQVRAKNTANVLMKNLMDWSLGILGYFLLGLGVAYLAGGLTSPGSVSLGEAFAYVSDPTAWIGWLFGAVFAMTAATIVSGAVAGRIKFAVYVAFAAVMSVVIYPVVQGLVWEGGLLSEAGYLGLALGTGYMDFAGATVVHMTGGVAGLLAAAMVGARTGRFDDDGSSNPIPGHSVFLAMLGTFVLAFGWYGFNVGTQATVLTEEGVFQGAKLGRVALITTLGMAAGAVAAALGTTAVRGDPDPVFTSNGLLAGLVAVTGAANAVTWWGGIVLGALGGAMVMPVHMLVVERFNVDDVCGVFAVHGAAGAAGTLLIPLFAAGAGGGWQPMGPAQFLMQAAGIVVISVWVSATTIGTFGVLDQLFGGLRVDDEDEDDGLDAAEHSIAAYPEFAVTDGGVDTTESDETDTDAPDAPPSGPTPSAEASTTMWRGQEVETGQETIARANLDAVVAAIAGPALVVHGDGVVSAANDAACSLFGTDRDALVDRPLGFDDRVEATIADVVDAAAGNRESILDRTVDPSEWDRTLSVSAGPLRSGAVDGVLVLVSDVTDRLERRDRREARLDYYETLLERHAERLGRLADGHLEIERGVESPGAFDDVEAFDALESIHDRFVTLDEAVHTVAEDVRSIVEQLPDQSAELADRSAALSDYSQEVMEAVEETDRLSSDIEAKVRTLTEQATEVQNNVEQQSAAIEQISASTTEIREQSTEASERTDAAVENVKEAVAEIRSAADSSDEVVAKIDALEERMDDVSNIVDVIQNIAQQTNMLALNASIEAAHADAEGDGFAVVAEEVKSLAEQARSQTSEIESIVGAVEEQTADVTETIGTANQEIRDSADALTAVVDSLETARERVTETNQGVAEISDAVERQAETATTVSAIMEDTNDLAREIDENVRQISANADEQTAAVGEVATTADELSDLAAAVDANVDAFDASSVVAADDD